MSHFSIQDRVRWSDCDPLGIIHYSTYLRLFEVAEHEMFRACGLPYEVLRKAGGVWLPRVGSTSLTMRFEVYRDGDRVHRASGSLTVVCVHRDTMQKFPLPDEVRRKIAPYVEEAR